LGRRRLLTPDELFRFPNDELLIVIRGENCLRARKFDYTGHPYAKRMIPSSIFEYNPRHEPRPEAVQAPCTENAKRAEPQTEIINSGFPQAEIKKPAKLFAAAKPPDEF
jgi:type IV secretion system protein VirD4